jgi:hypothetical protein
MSYGTINAKTYEQLASQSGANIPLLWSRMTLGRSRRKDPLAQLSGKQASGRCIIEHFEPGKKAGETVRVRLDSAVGMPPVIGAANRIGKQGQVRFKHFDCKVDWKHGSIAITDKESGLMGVEVDGMAMEKLGDWFGILKRDEAMISARQGAGPFNTVFANNVASINQLRGADVLNTSLVDTARLQAQSNGAVPADVRRDQNGNDIEMFVFLATNWALQSWVESNNVVNAALNAANRGNDNYMFTGGFYPWNGSAIIQDILRDEPLCPAGSAMAARAYLGEAITADDAALTIKGGRFAEALTLDPQPWWFGGFENFDWPFYEGQSAATFTEEKYLLIINMSGTDAGKCGMYAYTSGNSGHEIVLTKRLGPTDSHAGGNIQYAEIGSVTWNTGKWLNKHTQTHDEGALIVQCNSAGQPYGWSMLMGTEAILRCHGDPLMLRRAEDQNMGMVKARGFDSVFGQTAVKSYDGISQNLVLAYHSLTIPGANLPVLDETD